MKKFENAAMPKSTLAYRVLSPPALLRQTGTRLAQRANQLDQRPHRRLESRWRGRENHRAPSQTVASRNALKGKMRTAAPGSCNVDGGVAVTVVNRAALAAYPLPDCQSLVAFRAVDAQAGRAGLGGEFLVDRGEDAKTTPA